MVVKMEELHKLVAQVKDLALWANDHSKKFIQQWECSLEELVVLKGEA